MAEEIMQLDVLRPSGDKLATIEACGSTTGRDVKEKLHDAIQEGAFIETILAGGQSS